MENQIWPRIMVKVYHVSNFDNTIMLEDAAHSVRQTIHSSTFIGRARGSGYILDWKVEQVPRLAQTNNDIDLK